MAQSILAYKLRNRFSLDMQFSQNHRANYGASFKALKVMLLPLKCQIFCFLSKFVLFTQASRKQILISKIWLCHFLVYIAKHPHAKNEEHPLSRSWEKWVDGQMNRTDVTGTLLQRWRFDHVLQKRENKTFQNYLAWLWVICNGSIQNKCQR